VHWYDYAKRHYIAEIKDQLPDWVTAYYDPLLHLNHIVPLSSSLIMWALYLLPNDQEMARRLYDLAKRDCLAAKADGTAHMVAAPGRTRDDIFTTALTLSLANELGDTEVVKTLRAHAEAHYEPTWDRDTGEFYYLFGLREPHPRGKYNANLMVSEVAGSGAWWRLFNEPNLRKFEEPTVYGVDYPRMGLSQAYYDRERRTLVLQTYTNDQAARGTPTSFRIQNLAEPGRCTVLADDAPYSSWGVREGELEVTMTIGRRSLRIIEP
jgi:hypothetical protein